MNYCPACGSRIQPALPACPVCGTTLSLEKAPYVLPVGTTLKEGTYTIGRVLGQGGFGITYKGAEPAQRRVVAIKEFFPQSALRKGKLVIYPPTIPEAPHQLERFVEEGRLLQKLQHPHIVRVFDIVRENSTAYLIMEFLDGMTLQAYVQQHAGPLSETEAMLFFRQIVEALSVLHKMNYIHRDIKPQNIFITLSQNAPKRAVLIDFGAARRFALDVSMAHTRIFTEGYAAPEQYTNRAKFGPYTDFYALGATFYFALSGQEPPASPARLHKDTLTHISQHRQELSVPFAQLLMNCMELKIGQRPQRAEDLLRALQKASSHR